MASRVLVGTVLIVAASLAAEAQTAQFIPLDAKCGPAFFPTFCVVDMSGDGNTILYRDRVWNNVTGYQTIGPEGGYRVTALSDDGSTVLGDYLLPDGHIEAAIWLGGDQWKPLGGLPGAEPCGYDLSDSYDISGDGKTVVGLGWLGSACSGAHAFKWTEATGMVDMGSIVPNRASRANGISADGHTVAGWSDSDFGYRLGARWDGDGAPVWFTPDNTYIGAGEAQGLSSDGSIIVGGAYDDYTNPARPAHVNEPWLWSRATGKLTPLGTAKGLRGDVTDGQHYARDVNDAGTAVIGQTTLFNLGEQWAFFWTKQDGMSLLQDYLRAHTDKATAAKICSAKRGVLQPCKGWDFWNTAAISNDGKIIVGTGVNPDGIFQAFMIKLP